MTKTALYIPGICPVEDHLRSLSIFDLCKIWKTLEDFSKSDDGESPLPETIRHLPPAVLDGIYDEMERRGL